MEVSKSVKGMEVGSGFPRVFTDAIALPLDEVVEFATHDPAIKNLFDFELFVIIDDIRQRRGSRTTAGEGIRRREFQSDTTTSVAGG